VWTGYSSALDRSVLKKTKFLEEAVEVVAVHPLPDGRGSVGHGSVGHGSVGRGSVGRGSVEEVAPKEKRPESSSPFASKLKDALKS